MEKNKFYHLSFNGKLQGVWKPKLPDGPNKPTSEKDLTEFSQKRISVSPDIKKCFQAIYSNISKYFEIENYPCMLFYVYAPLINQTTKILTPENLTKNRFVHDAHMTDEHCIMTDVYMKLESQIKIMNTNKSKPEYYYPFNDRKLGLRYFAPKDINFEIVKTYDDPIVTDKLRIDAW